MQDTFDDYRNITKELEERGAYEQGSPYMNVHVIMAAIPPREKLRSEAVNSVHNQTVRPRKLHIALDIEHKGAAVSRNSALEDVPEDADFISFLDDDDIWYPFHLETHLELLHKHGADVAYSWFDGNPALQNMWTNTHRGKDFDPENPHHTTMTLTVRWSKAKHLRFPTDHPEGWILPQEDWRYILSLRDAGLKFVGTKLATWFYRVHENNTSGLPNRW